MLIFDNDGILSFIWAINDIDVLGFLIEFDFNDWISIFGLIKFGNSFERCGLNLLLFINIFINLFTL
jgi:hypothetical protein